MNGQQDSMSEDKVKPSETAKTEQDDLLKWQEKVLPTMRAMLIGLTIFFFIPSLIQLGYLHQSIFEGSKLTSLNFRTCCPRAPIKPIKRHLQRVMYNL